MNASEKLRALLVELSLKNYSHEQRILVEQEYLTWLQSSAIQLSQEFLDRPIDILDYLEFIARSNHVPRIEIHARSRIRFK